MLAGTDVAGTIADEIALLADHGLTAGQAIAAAGSLARDFLGIHPAGDIVTYDHDPREDPGVLARPRGVLRRVLDRAAGMGCKVKAAAEFEFFVFDETPQSIREKGYRNLKPITPGNVRSATPSGTSSRSRRQRSR